MREASKIGRLEFESQKVHDEIGMIGEKKVFTCIHSFGQVGMLLYFTHFFRFKKEFGMLTLKTLED